MPIRLRHALWTLPALAGVIVACGSEKGPTQPANTLTFTAVSTGGNHTCGLTAAGAAYAGATTATASLATEPRLTGQARCSWQAA